jgi:hypothetical protein
MILYNVYLYREICLTFHRIEADTPEAAAAIASDRTIREADDIDDCDGEDFVALVDVIGDDGFNQSKTIEFAAERLRKAAPALLDALQDLLGDLPSVQDGECRRCGREYDDIDRGNCPADDCPSFKARAAIALAIYPHNNQPERNRP